MPDFGLPDSPIDHESTPGGEHASSPGPESEREWPTTGTDDSVIAVASTGTVTAMNVAAVSLLGPPAPHQFGLGIDQFIPARYHRVIDAWADRQPGDARAAHPDRLTLSLAAVRADGGEVWVLLTRRMLGEGPTAPYLVTMREVANGFRSRIPPAPQHVRHWLDRPSPVFG